MNKELSIFVFNKELYEHDSVAQNQNGFQEAQREVAQEMDHVYIGYNETEFFMERGWLVDVVHYNQEALNDIGKKLAHLYISIEK